VKIPDHQFEDQEYCIDIIKSYSHQELTKGV